MSDIDYKLIIDGLTESVEQAKKFRESSKNSLDEIKKIETLITDDIREQEKILFSISSLISNQLLEIDNKSKKLVELTNSGSIKAVQKIETATENGIKLISQSIDKGIDKLHNEISNITEKTSIFEKTSESYVKEVKKMHLVIESTITNLGSSITKSINELWSEMNRISKRLDKMYPVIEDNNVMNREDNFNYENFVKKEESKTKATTTLYPNNENAYDLIVKSIGIPLVLTIYEDLIKGVPDRVIYGKISNKKQVDQIRILNTIKKWKVDGKQDDFLSHLKTLSKNHQILERINRLS